MPNASTQTVSCSECDEALSIWWDDEDGDHFCADCFRLTGASCGGCDHEECRLCHHDEEDDSDSEEEEEEFGRHPYYICMVLSSGYRDWCSADSLQAARDLYEEFRNGCPGTDIVRAEAYDSTGRNRISLDAEEEQEEDDGEDICNKCREKRDDLTLVFVGEDGVLMCLPCLHSHLDKEGEGEDPQP